MNLKTLLIGLSLIAFGTASAYAAGDDKKSADKDKAAATSSMKKDAKASSSDGKAAAGATAKKDEKDEKDAKKPAK